MARILMYWDLADPSGDPTSGIDVDGYPGFEAPENACGFRLQVPDKKWTESWLFLSYGSNAPLVGDNGLEYSLAGWLKLTGEFPDFIEARGPVHGCSEGSYQFAPLGSAGIPLDGPVEELAGSFVADFFDIAEITWLDSAGQELPPIDLPQPPDPSDEDELPPEFFEAPPDVKGCFRDFEGTLHCPKEADTTALPAAGHIRTFTTIAAPPAIALILGLEEGTIPHFTAEEAPARAVNVVPSTRVELDCPARLVLTATFYLISYRSATAPEPNSIRPTSFKSTSFESPANNVGPWPASLGWTTNSYSSINPSSANASGSVTPPVNSPLPGSCLSC